MKRLFIRSVFLGAFTVGLCHELPNPVLSSAGDQPVTVLGEDTFEWPDSGTLLLTFEFPEIEGTLELAPELREDYLNARIFDLPFLKGRFWSSYTSGVHRSAGFALLAQNTLGKEHRLQAAMSRLDGKKPYHLAVVWDINTQDVRFFLQGVEQGDMTHWGTDHAPMAPPGKGSASFGGAVRHQGNTLSPVEVRQVKVYDVVLTPVQIASQVDLLNLPGLSGEGRTVYDRGLDLEGLEKIVVFTEEFRDAPEWIHEEDLLQGHTRVKVPDADWILEGPAATLHHENPGIRLSTSSPDDRKVGHMVLWLNKQVPADFLLEYSFTPENDRKGLGIVFFNARNPGGTTLFDLNLSPRRGKFREYIMGEIESYHVSPWAADDQNLRRTANMRKNPGFLLVSVGNDRIGGSGSAPYQVRILKQGPRVQVEVDDQLVLEHQDNGQAHGPVYEHAGLIGFRFMAHSRSAVIHDVRIFNISGENRLP